MDSGVEEVGECFELWRRGQVRSLLLLQLPDQPPGFQRVARERPLEGTWHVLQHGRAGVAQHSGSLPRPLRPPLWMFDRTLQLQSWSPFPLRYRDLPRVPSASAVRFEYTQLQLWSARPLRHLPTLLDGRSHLPSRCTSLHYPPGVLNSVPDCMLADCLEAVPRELPHGLP